jgi:hypothetical protein
VKRWTLFAFALAAYAVALVALAPATLIDARLQHMGEGTLRLAEARGSLWSGAGWIEVRDAHGRAGIARRISWRVLPVSLLRGRLVADIELDQADRRFPVTVSLSRVEVGAVHVRLPAAAPHRRGGGGHRAAVTRARQRAGRGHAAMARRRLGADAGRAAGRL